MGKISSRGRHDAHVEQHGGQFQILNGGPSIALSGFTTGNDTLKEQEGLVVGTGGATTPTGFIIQGGTDSLSITATYPKVTVV